MKPNAVVFYALGALALAPECVSAQDRYPSKPIQMLVAYSTGTTTDSSHAINPSLYARLPYDSGRDFGREPATTDEAREIFGIRR